MRILVAEDDSPLASFISKGLTSEQFAVDVAKDGEEAVNLVSECDYDLMVLDLKLPRLGGFEVLERVRRKKPSLPIVVLSGMNRTEDRVRGLDLGADDYLTKPFAIDELLARVRALLRRGATESPGVLQVDDLLLNPATREVTRGGQRIDLTLKEYALLEYLMRRAGAVVTRAEILERVWGYDAFPTERTIDNFIVRLRRVLEPDPQNPRYIHTVRGTGYRLTP